jgi:hypothetical protein
MKPFAIIFWSTDAFLTHSVLCLFDPLKLILALTLVSVAISN